MKLTLKDQLELLLRDRGITASELSRRTEVPRSVLGDWMAGAEPRNLVALRRVSEALNTTIEELCFGDGTGVRRIRLEELLGDDWIDGCFELRLRRVKK